MGSLLSAAVPRLRAPEEANLRAPETVVSLHVAFINAGADLIETNSFGANRHKLAHHLLDDELQRINAVSVKLAREARELTGKDVFIAGAIGPLGRAADDTERQKLFAEQAAILEDRGSDLFMLETFYDLEELVMPSAPSAASRRFRSSHFSPSTSRHRRSRVSARARPRAVLPSLRSLRSAPTTAPVCSPR